MTLATDAMFGAMELGEQFEQAIVLPPFDMSKNIWTVGWWPIIFPDIVPRAAPNIQIMVKKLRARTGWSARTLADVLKTSHTTILEIERGRSLKEGHSGDLGRRVIDAYEVVERVYLLTGKSVGETARVMRSSCANGNTPVEELQAQELGRAYLAVVDVLHPRPRGLIVGDHPKQGDAIVALHD